MGSFNQRFEALFPCAGALGCPVCFAPRHSSRFIYARVWGRWVLPAALPAPFSATLSPAFSVYLCVNVGPQGLLVVRLPALFVPHSASLSLPRPRESSPPRLPVSAPPTGLDARFFSFFLFFNIFIDYAITVVPFPPLHSILSAPSLPHSPPIVRVLES